MAHRMPLPHVKNAAGAADPYPSHGICCRIASCNVYRALNQYPYMGVWKRLYCQGSFTACRHFSSVDDGLLSP